MKRFLGITAIILIAVSFCLVLSSCAGGKTDENGLIYTLDKESDTYSVTGYTGTAKEIQIPAKYDTRLVTSIGASAFLGNKTLEKITIPEGVTSIGANAFNGCVELKEVVFDGTSKITELSAGVFSGCTKLNNVKLPDGVKKIGYKAFNSCTAMKAIALPASVEVIDYYAFSGCSSLSEVDFDTTKTFKVYANAFYMCDDLTTLMTPEVSKEEAKSAVYTYRNGTLTSVKDGGMELIKWLNPADENGAVTIAADIVDIHPQAFTDRQDIKKFIVDEKNQKYSTDDAGILYSKDKTVLVAYPSGAEGISLTVAEGVKKIGDYSFCGNLNIETVELPTTLKTIGDAAFKDSFLKKLVLADADEIKVCPNAFAGCKSFETYRNLDKETEYLLRDRVLFDAEGTKLISYSKEDERTEYTIDKTVKDISYGAFRHHETLAKITVDAENEFFMDKDGVLYKKNAEGLPSELVTVPRAKTFPNNEYVMPESVTSIAPYVFYKNTNIKAVTFNNKCKVISAYMFYEVSSLEKIVFPANELDFGECAIKDCTALTVIEFGGNDVAWKKAVSNSTEKEMIENQITYTKIEK